MSCTDDFLFACEMAADSANPWHLLHVVSFRGTEALSSLYRYEIIVLAHDPTPAIDPDELLGQRGTLHINTLTEPPCRVVHGIVIEAEELGRVPTGILYRLVLAPPFARAMHRSRCRVFVEKTTRQIVDMVLQGDPELTPATAAVVLTNGPDNARFAMYDDAMNATGQRDGRHEGKRRYNL